MFLRSGLQLGSAFVFSAAFAACAAFTAGTTPTPATTDDGGSGDSGDADSSGASLDGGGGDGKACASRLCSDFDPPNLLLPFGWQEFGPSPLAASRFLFRSESVSPPNALHLVANVVGGEEQALWLRQDLGEGSEVSIRFSVRVDEHSGDKLGMRLIELTCDDSTFFKLKVTSSGSIQADLGPSEEVVKSTLGQWMAIDIVIATTADKESARATIAVDGVAAAASPIVGEKGCAKTRVLRMGNIVSSETGTTGVYDVSYDNILVDWK